MSAIAFEPGPAGCARSMAVPGAGPATVGTCPTFDAATAAIATTPMPRPQSCPRLRDADIAGV